MSDVRKVTAQLRAPTDRDPGQVTFGFYTREGDTITMTDETGRPVRSRMGDLVRHELQPGQSEESIARVLTKQIRRERTGEDVAGFNRRLKYPVSSLP